MMGDLDAVDLGVADLDAVDLGVSDLDAVDLGVADLDAVDLGAARRAHDQVRVLQPREHRGELRTVRVLELRQRGRGHVPLDLGERGDAVVGGTLRLKQAAEDGADCIHLEDWGWGWG